jgi:hypothetical protein
MLAVAGVCLAWAGAQMLIAHRPADAPLEAPKPSELVEVRVDVAAIAHATGAAVTWSQLFARYGLELSVQRQTLDFQGNWQNGRAPDPNAAITQPFVTVVLSG